MTRERRYAGAGGRRDLSAASGSATNPVRAILGASYISEFRASYGVTKDGSNKVSSLLNVASEAAAVQGTGARQPTWGAASFNGGPGITFAKASNTLLLCTLNSALAANTRVYFWLVANRTGGDGEVMAGATGPGAYPVGAIFDFTNIGAFFGVRRQDAGTFDLINGPASDANRHLFEAGFTNGGTNSFVVDGAGFNSANDYTPAAGIANVVIGDVQGAGVAPCSGVFAHLVVSLLPSAGQITAMRTYLRGNNFPGYTGNNYGIP